MDYHEFISSTMCNFNQDVFNAAKEALISEYLFFSIIPDEDVTVSILSEKACDYFDKLALKTGNDFDKQIDAYIKAVDLIVSRRIAQTPKRKKKDASPAVVPRARKYYEKADSIRKTRNWKVRNLLDYSRIMFCLYAAIIENDYNEIQNLNFSVDSIKPAQIVNSMKNELDPTPIKVMKKMLFDIKDLYCSDTCTFIITIIVLFAIINEKVQGEYSHE